MHRLDLVVTPGPIIQVILSNRVAGWVDKLVPFSRGPGGLVLGIMSIGCRFIKCSLSTDICYNKCDDSSSSDLIITHVDLLVFIFCFI